MKSKFFIMILLSILLLTMIGCSVEETDPQQDPEQVAEEGVETEEPVVEETVLDSSLEGIDLFKSITSKRPKTMKLKMSMKTYGTTTDTMVYYEGDNTRTESVVEGIGTSILIYNAAEEVMYNYVEESGEGIRIIGADIESAEEAGLMMDMSTKFSGLTEEVSDDVLARVEKLDGEEVVYIETSESDEEMGDILVKMWYSVQYNIPLKYEVVMGQEPLMSLNVSEIEKNIKVDKKMFEAPSDIVFEDVDMADIGDMM